MITDSNQYQSEKYGPLIFPCAVCGKPTEHKVVNSVTDTLPHSREQFTLFAVACVEHESGSQEVPMQ